MPDPAPGPARPARRTTARARRARAGDAPPAEGPPAGRTADDAAVKALLELLSDGVAALPEALERREGARRVRAQETRDLLGSRELATAARQQPELRKKLALVGDELTRRDAEAETALAELRAAADGWLETLKGLHG